MTDILYDAAIEYERLKDIVYRIIIGRKNQAYEIRLHFPPEAFFHLAGLQHLTDITFPSKNKERIYREILNKKLKIEDVRCSVFYEKWFVEERLKNFKYLQTMIETNALYYKINAKRYIQYTDIRADYLCEYKQQLDIIYLFLVLEKRAPKFANECKGCSLFTKHDYEYTQGTAKTTTLLIEKQIEGNVIELYRNPCYVEREEVNY